MPPSLSSSCTNDSGNCFWNQIHHKAYHEYLEVFHVFNCSQQAGQKFMSFTSCCSGVILLLSYTSLHERHRFLTNSVAVSPTINETKSYKWSICQITCIVLTICISYCRSYNNQLEYTVLFGIGAQCNI